MFKPKRGRHQRTQPQNPISEMEQFYLHQYFQSNPNSYTPHPSAHPHANQSNDRFPPIEFARLHQLELRIARLEQYLGLTTAESGTESIIR